ncbi:MAG: hypothetical protein DMG59_07915 [Acidobacteria bacterium]|nr:MAG: hypothetical protein DMG59_07915 [Acidobacteriota bacterium]
MRLQIAIALSSASFFTVCAFSQTPAKEAEFASVKGKVVNSLTGDPIGKAAVILHRAQAIGSAYGALTEVDGSFALANLESGAYSISVERTGYAAVQNKRHRNLANMTLAPGQELAGLEFQLVPTGVITGRILDANGELVTHASLQLIPVKAGSSRREASLYATTNDLGEYRLFNVPPGRYYVKASVFEQMNVSWQRPASAKSSVSEGYVPTYYPGTLAEDRAMSVLVKPGGVLQGVDFAILRARVMRVRGRVAAPGASVILVTLSGNQGVYRDAMADPATGAFEFSGVTPGSYTLSAGTAIGGKPGLEGTRAVEIGDSDMDDVNLVLYPPVEIQGRIRIEESGRKIPNNLMVVLARRDSRASGGASFTPHQTSSVGNLGQVDPDGSFVLQGTHGARYDLMIGSLGMSSDNTYIKSATLGGIDVLGDGLEFPAGGLPVTLDIILSGKGASVDCVVTSEQNEPAAGARVILIPDRSRRARLDLYGECKTDQLGQCSVAGVAPGSYSLYAFDEDSGPLDYHASEALAPYEKSEKVITVKQQEYQKVRLDLLQEQ